MTVNTLVNGELKTCELPERIACLKHGACFGKRDCRDCGFYKPLDCDIDETKALFAEIDAATMAYANSGPVNENHVRGWKRELKMDSPRVVVGKDAPDWGGTAKPIPEPKLFRETGWWK